MLELKIVDESRAVHYVVLAQGRRVGEIAHADFNGLAALRLDGGEYVIRSERRAADLARGRRGVLRAVWSRLQPDQRYTLLQGEMELARVHSRATWARSRSWPDADMSSKPSAYACISPYSMPLWTILT